MTKIHFQNHGVVHYPADPTDSATSVVLYYYILFFIFPPSCCFIQVVPLIFLMHSKVVLLGWWWTLFVFICPAQIILSQIIRGIEPHVAVFLLQFSCLQNCHFLLAAPLEYFRIVFSRSYFPITDHWPDLL